MRLARVNVAEYLHENYDDSWEKKPGDSGFITSKSIRGYLSKAYENGDTCEKCRIIIYNERILK